MSLLKTSWCTMIFVECELGWWGPDCRNKCECSDEGTISCDKVRSCMCKPGYTGDLCEFDIDECEQNPNTCSDRQQCVNTAGSYICECRQGFVLENVECIGMLLHNFTILFLSLSMCLHFTTFTSMIMIIVSDD